MFTHLCNPFVMSLPIANTSHYQFVNALIYPAFYNSYLVFVIIFMLYLTEMGKFIHTTTQRGGGGGGGGGGGNTHDRFSYRLDSAGDKLIDWRCTKSKCKARLRTDETEYSTSPR